MKSAQNYSKIALKEMDKLIDYINLKMKLNVKGVDGKEVMDP